MRVAALFDIHGNLPALEAVLEDIRPKSDPWYNLAGPAADDPLR